MAWQVLGTELPGDFTAEEALKHGNLAGWNVRKSPEFTEVDGVRLVVPNRFAMVRDFNGKPEVMGSVGNVFHPFQNEEQTAFLDTLVDESGGHFVAAGATEGGGRVFVTMRMPGHVKVGGVDNVDHYITSVNGHNGGTKFGVMVHPIRTACTNVLTMGIKGSPHAYAYTVRHTSNTMKALVGEARRALDMTFGYMDDFQQEAERLINTTMTNDQFEQIVQREFGPKEDGGAAARSRAETKVDDLMRLFTEAGTQAGVRETAWAGLNALTEWEDHYSAVRGEERDERRAAKSMFEPKTDSLVVINRGLARL
jgi:phage/plasmid-like protein (TIGR03299 family)